MSVFISHTTIDAHNAYELAEWWKKILDYTDIPGDPNLPEHPECMIVDPHSSHRILFIAVPDESLPAKRIHFDVRPRERTRDEEVQWLLAQGASQLQDCRGIHGPGSGWIVMADPEGNQFCVLRSEAESAATQD